MLIYQGGKTYPSISKSNQKFITALKAFAPETTFHVQKSKKHIPMIMQYLNPWNKRYGEIIRFMENTKDKDDSGKKNEVIPRDQALIK